jgi:redox-sensitive bicupin YhaK (pirin superfamily)
MDYVRSASDRGRASFGWLESRHSFSFGKYYDPAHMGISVLRVINDDIVAPGAGFGTHGHRDMEIISYVLEGAMRHEDSAGHQSLLSAGEVQRMSAGSGVMHSEFNDSASDRLHFLQIWIQPQVMGIAPEYEQKRIRQSGPLTPLVTPDGREGSLMMHQDASLLRLILDQAEPAERFATGDRLGYLHVVRGDGMAAGRQLGPGDALAFNPDREFDVTAGAEGLEALWFDLPLMNR